MLQGDFKSSITVFDKIEVEALQMADTITIAIVKAILTNVLQIYLIGETGP